MYAAVDTVRREAPQCGQPGHHKSDDRHSQQRTADIQLEDRAVDRHSRRDRLVGLSCPPVQVLVEAPEWDDHDREADQDRHHATSEPGAHQAAADFTVHRQSSQVRTSKAQLRPRESTAVRRCSTPALSWGRAYQSTPASALGPRSAGR
jgi:hypothetical protein